VAECGASAEEAFGPAEEYAKSLDLPHIPGNSLNSSIHLVIFAIIGLVGMTVTLWGFHSWYDGTPVHVTVGMAVSAALTIVISSALPFIPPFVLTAVVLRRWVIGLVFGGWMALTFLLLLLFNGRLIQLPVWPVLIVGVILIVVYSAFFFTYRVPEDPIAAPLSRVDSPPPRPHRQIALALLYPVGTVVLALGYVLIKSLAS